MAKKGEKVKYTKDGKPINIRRYSNSFKLEVARKVTQTDGHTISGVARDHGLPESTVRQWVKDLDKLDNHIKSHGDLKTIHRDKQPTLSRFLRAYCEECISQDPPLNITAQMISTKASAISNDLLKEYETNEDVMELNEATALMKMTFSTSWAMEWAKKNQFVHRKVKKDEEAPVVDEVGLFRKELKQYDAQYLYCLVDPIFYYKVLPRQKYVIKSETEGSGKVKSTNGMKLKDRVTLYVCTNASGTDKVPLTMIGNAKNPRCFGKDNTKELFKYMNQDNGWSDIKTMKRWFLEVFLPHIRTTVTDVTQKILLIIPFASKELVDDLKQVKCVTLPTTVAAGDNNSTNALHMPLTVGVVSALKRNYRYQLLKDVLIHYQKNYKKESTKKVKGSELNKKMIAGTAGLAEGREPHLLDVMEMLESSWNDIDESFISVNWIKAGLVGNPNTLPYSIRRRNPITELLLSISDQIIFILQDIELPKETNSTTKDNDPMIENIRNTYKYYKNVGEEQYINSFENIWISLEDHIDIIELIRDEREECLNIDEEQYRDSLREIQEALIDPRYMKAVDYIQDARNEFFRVSKANKRIKLTPVPAPTQAVIKKDPVEDAVAAHLGDDMSIQEEV